MSMKIWYDRVAECGLVVFNLISVERIGGGGGGVVGGCRCVYIFVD